MANHNLQPVRSYGEAAVPLRFGFCPYGSTKAGTIQPFIPNVTRDPTFGPQPRWGGASVVHDGQYAGRYNILLDDDWQDFTLSIPEVRCNLNITTPTLFLPSTTAGSGIQITGVNPGPGILATIPIVSVVTASGGAGTTSSAAISAGVITITAKVSATNATVAANINANTATLGVTAATVGTSTDITYVAAATFVFSPIGCNSPDMFQASCSLVSATSTIFMTYTANTAGPDPVTIIYLAGGAGTAASAALSVVAPNTVILTVDTSATIATVLTAINVTAVATVGKLITAGYTTTASNTQGHAATAVGTVAISGTTQNLTGTLLTGGGLLSARYSGATVGDANSKSSQLGTQLFHLNVSVYQGDTLVDLNAQSELFVPSQGVITSLADANSGVLFQSISTAAAAATCQVLSTSGAGVGNTFNANEPGDAGNNNFVIYNNPLATIFIPSTTGGDGNLFTAVAAGAAGRGVQISQSVPTGAATVITVNGSSINIQPKSGETNTGVVNAIAANAAAAALVTVSATAGSDVVSGTAFNPANLGGGYTQGSATASAVQMANNLGGVTVVVNFGTNCTNATVLTAVNAIPGGALTAVALGTTTDHVVATNATQLTGGTDPTDASVQYTFVGSTVPATAALTGSALVITIAAAGDTNANIAAACNSAAGNGTIVATVVGAGADTNLAPPSTGAPNVGFQTTGSMQLAPQNLVCHNIINLDIMARNSMNGVV